MVFNSRFLVKTPGNNNESISSIIISGNFLHLDAFKVLKLGEKVIMSLKFDKGNIIGNISLYLYFVLPEIRPFSEEIVEYI